MTALHRTPTHVELLRAVHASRVTWLPKAGVSGAPAVAGQRLTDLSVLTAFFELKQAGMVTVADELVVLTPAGAAQFALWDMAVTR